MRLCAILVVLLAAVGYFAVPFVLRLARIPRELVPASAKRPDALRIGLLGAASIAPPALIWPSWKTADVVVAAVAARNRERAVDFAGKYGIPKVHDSYEALVADPELDAIYIPLPNGLHREWAVRAMRAGKHVLCEKPLASNRVDAENMHTVSKETNRVLMEAFHYRFHPLAKRMEEVVKSGKLGRVLRIETEGELPVLFVPDTDIRYNNRGNEPKLAGGALMDIGCYAVNSFRMLAAAAGESDVRVINASIVEKFSQVDGHFVAEVQAGPIRGSITASMMLPSYKIFNARARVYGELGEMEVFNFIVPFAYNYLTVKTLGSAGDPESTETTSHYDVNDRTTYELQLDAFVQAVAAGRYEEIPGSSEDAVHNMALIDTMYTASGLKPRHGY